MDFIRSLEMKTLLVSKLRLVLVLHLALVVAAAGLMLTWDVRPAQAQATRTWVSGVGDDANPCSRTAPCKTFAGAISKTATNGEINCLDSAGFGALTITKSITVDCRGLIGGVLAAGTNGINVNAGLADVIILRGLDMDGANSGFIGINYIAGGSVIVENTTIRRFNAGSGRGIFVNGPAAVGQFQQLSVSDCDIVFNGIAAAGPIIGGGGIIIGVPTGAVPAGAIRGSVQNTRLIRNAIGLRAGPNSSTTVHNVQAMQNNTNGFAAISGGGGVFINIDDSTASESINGTGVTANGTNALVRLSRTTVVSNSIGLERVGAAVIESFGDNYIRGNFAGNGPAPTIVPFS
jgi:hypothetical protein